MSNQNEPLSSLETATQLTPPGATSNLKLVPCGPGSVFATWTKAPRAEKYRVYKQVLGTDIAPIQVTREVRCTEFTFIALPANSQVQVTIKPVNRAGYGPASFPVQIEVPA